MKKYSIIIPVYNSEKYLNTCITSVLQQTEKNLELILINDGSSDRSGKICDDWKNKDDRVIVIHQKNAGAAAARNTGICVSNGEFIIFLDADDWWMDSFVLEKINRRLEIEKVDVLIFNFVKSSDTGELKQKYFSCPSLDSKKNGYCFEIISKYDLWISSPCNKVISSSLFENKKLRFREGIFSEDLDWCTRLALSAQKFDYVDLCVFVYRQHNDSTSNSMEGFTNKKRCQFDNIKECIRIVEQTSDTNKKTALLSYLAYQYGVFVYSIAMCDDTDQKHEILKEAQAYVGLLNFSNNKKIRIIRYIIRIFGYSNSIFILKWCHKLKMR